MTTDANKASAAQGGAGLRQSAVTDSGGRVLSPCPEGMNAERASALNDCFARGIIKGGNVAVPEFICEQGCWVCAEQPYPSLLDGYGARFFPLFAPAHRQRILLSAANALRTLHRAGLVHGSLSASALRVAPAGDRSFHVHLTGFAYCCKIGQTSAAGYPVGYVSPRAGKAAPTPQADIFALGVCFYLWMVGCLPRWDGIGAVLVPNSVPRAYCRLFSAMLRQKGTAYPTLEQILARLGDSGAALSGDDDFKLFPVCPPADGGEPMPLPEDAEKAIDLHFVGTRPGNARW